MVFTAILLFLFALLWGLLSSKKTSPAIRIICWILGAFTVSLFLWFMIGFVMVFIGDVW